jgi:hypothetical protein
LPSFAKGTITALSSSSLELVGSATRRTFAEDDVRTISHARGRDLVGVDWPEPEAGRWSVPHLLGKGSTRGERDRLALRDIGEAGMIRG